MAGDKAQSLVRSGTPSTLWLSRSMKLTIRAWVGDATNAARAAGETMHFPGTGSRSSLVDAVCVDAVVGSGFTCSTLDKAMAST